MPDTFLTIAAPAEASLRERSSRFLAFACPVQTEEQIRAALAVLRKKYYDATHVCYAWRLGAAGENFRSSDDREPSGTAGKPILGQLLSASLTDCLVVVVRYFGGTKLGVPGLIAAYKEAAAGALAAAETVERTVGRTLRIEFPYAVSNEMLRIVRAARATVLSQRFDNRCTMELSIRLSRAEELIGQLEKAGAEIIQNYKL